MASNCKKHIVNSHFDDIKVKILGIEFTIRFTVKCFANKDSIYKKPFKLLSPEVDVTRN